MQSVAGIRAFPLRRACKETWWWESIRIYWFCNRDFITQFLWHQSTFFSCILTHLYIYNAICVAKLRETEGRGTLRIFVKTKNRIESLHRLKQTVFFFFVSQLVKKYNYNSLLKTQDRRNKQCTNAYKCSLITIETFTRRHRSYRLSERIIIIYSHLQPACNKCVYNITVDGVSFDINHYADVCGTSASITICI